MEGDMNYSQAVTLAIKSIEKEIKEITVNANLYEYAGVESMQPTWEHRKKLRQAMGVLKGQPRLSGKL